MIVENGELAGLRSDLENSTIAFRLGSYDILHAGHQAGINFAAEQADVLVVGVMPDEYISRIKGPTRPINPESERLDAIDQAPKVAYSTLVPNGRLAVASLFMKLRPDAYVEEDVRSNLAKAVFLRALGIRYVTDRYSRIYSTSRMIEEFGIDEASSRSSLTFSPETTSRLS